MKIKPKFALGDLARRLGGEVEGDPDFILEGVLPFDQAGPGQITCAMDKRFLSRLNQTRAGAVIVGPEAPESDKNLLRVASPYPAFARTIALFHPLNRKPGVHETVVAGEDFSHGLDPSIQAGVVMGDRVSLGDQVTLMANVVLGDDVVLGDEVVLHPGVKILDRCLVGDRTVIHAGTVVGSDGYGFAPDGEPYVKVPQLGRVRIGSDVEIGANNTIDRATFDETVIGNGVKTDNLVHVAHNVIVGDHTLLVAQAGISGSVTIGRHAIVAGQAGIADHVKIGDNAVVLPQAGIAKDIAPATVVGGTPGMPHGVWLRVQRLVGKLPEIHKDFLGVKKRLAALEKKMQGRD